jgi:hypothetical protein
MPAPTLSATPTPALSATPAPALSATPAPTQPAPAIRAQYQWGYAGAEGQAKGLLNILLDPATGRTVVELQGLGERLMLLQGDSAAGYHVQIPRRKVDTQAPTLAAVQLPFFPQVGSPDALYRLLTEGSVPGVKVTSRDADGPVKLRYEGSDDQGREVTVWLKRTRWETGNP